MGTVPFNFPPEAVQPIGAILGSSSLGNTGPLPTTVFFTAPTAGVYGWNQIVHVVSTDGAGSINATVKTPYSAAQTAGKPVANDSNNGTVAWFNKGDQLTISTVTPGLVATVYEVYLAMRRLF